MTQPGAAARTLTDEQERAAQRRSGSLLLAAGAGSGKTAVLVERFARAVVQDGIAPGRILAISFTERAAGELRERVRARLLELGRRDAARQAEAAFVSTFHGFCARLLRAHPLQAGVEPAFRILDEGFASRLQEQAFAQALAAFVAGEREPAVDLVAAYGADPLRAIVLGAYAQLRSQGVGPRLPVPPSGSEERAAAACRLLDELLDRFAGSYAASKRVRAALDFDDLELFARDLLVARPELRARWSERFELLMVDEFQDTNQRQLQILAALDRDNLFTVGDELQSIYSFRHADVALFRRRGEDLAEQDATLALTGNFRSRPPILAAVQRVFAERMGSRFAALAPTRELPPGSEPCVELLLTDRRGWEHSSAVAALAGQAEATPWRAGEACVLAARLHELVTEEGVRPGEAVVLLRSLGDLPVYEAALRARGLPTAAAVGGFWSHRQVADLVAWLRVLANPLDEIALYSALASPLVGISSDGLALIATFAHAASCQRSGDDPSPARGGGGVWQAIEQRGGELEGLLGEGDRQRLRAFRSLFAAERAELALRPIAELLARAITASGYRRHVLALEWGERRLASVHKLLRLARSFEAQEGRDLRGFLDHVAHVEVALGGREADAIAGEEVEAIRLMSVHAAKGLEFPVVCVADLGREPNLRQPDLLVDAADGRVGLRLLSLEQADATPALAYEELRAERVAAQLQEEDRILYVACTRARERLLLSGAIAFERWPAVRDGSPPIAWIAPSLVPDTPALAAAEPPPSGPTVLEPQEGLAVRCLLNAPVTPGAAAASGRDDLGTAAVRGQEPSAAPTRSAPQKAVPQKAAPQKAAPQRAELRACALGERAPDAGEREATTPNGREAAASEYADPAAQPVEPAAPLADPDGTISYSSLAELQRCGYRHYLERVLLMPERRVVAAADRRGVLDPRLRGTIVHALLERVDFARPRVPTDRDVSAAARRLGVAVTAAQRDELIALLERALASEPAALLARMRAPRREHPFAFALERLTHGASAQLPLLVGFIDLIGERPDGGTLVVDYKSDRLTGEEDLEEIVRRDYAFQRSIYALAAIEAGAQEVEVAHWFLERPAGWVSARFHREQGEQLRERLAAAVLALRKRGFAVSEQPHRELCQACPGRGGLCSWGETHTMRERSATLAATG
jgi:ATP-dependent exoDNAse (exonuclease V) beta subunit